MKSNFGNFKLKYFMILAILLIFHLWQTYSKKLYKNELIALKLINNTLAEECEKKTGILLSALINKTPIPPEYASDVSKFLFYSGWLGSYGDYKGCLKLESAQYNTINLLIDPKLNAKMPNGLCYFKECDTSYINQALDNLKQIILVNTGYNLTVVSISNPKETNEKINSYYVPGFITMITITILLILIQVACAMYKYFAKRIVKEVKNENYELIERASLNKPKQKQFFIVKLLLCFDFQENATKVLSTKKATDVLKALSVFDGVRVLSICYVIFGHVIIVGLSAFSNYQDLVPFFKSWKFCILTGGYYAVDVFFYMSGFLFYLGLQKYLDKDISKCKLIFMSFFNRYIRLLPVYLFAIFGWTYLMPMIWDGPGMPSVDFFKENLMTCTYNFWKNLLYINNFANGFGCVGAAWYLSNDMQFFLISILIFILFNKNKLIRDMICLSIFVGSIISSIFVSYHYEFAYNDYTHKYDTTGDFLNDFYIMPYIRITTYMLGLYFAEFFIHSPVYIKEKEEKEFMKKHDPNNKINIKTESDEIHHDNTNDSHEINKVEDAYAYDTERENETIMQKEKGSILYRFNMALINNNILSGFLFIFCLVGINFSVFSTYFTNNYEIPLIVHSLFHAFNKIIFVGSLGLILHLTFLGKLRFIYSILSFGFFIPLARITFAVFLIHMNIQIIFFFVVGTNFYFSFFSMGILTVGFAIISYFFAFFISLIYESPVINIMKKFIGGSE